MTYESVKRRLRLRYGDKEFSSLVYFLVGSIAKTIATVLTYPLQILQTKLRVCFQQIIFDLNTFAEKHFVLARSQNGGSATKCINAGNF